MKKDYVVFQQTNNIDNMYMTSIKPFHFDAYHSQYGLKVTLKQAIHITHQLNREAKHTYSYSSAYGYVFEPKG